ncbi:MAG: hypothetical protein ACU0CI_10245 [Shimia sp.]
MDFPLVWLLPIATFLLVIGWALWSKKKTEDRKDRDSAPKSSLAVDGDPHKAVK